MNKFYLTQEQLEIYHWLKAQKLNTDDDTLSYWARSYDLNRIKEVVIFAQMRLLEGQKILNIGGWIHKFLKTGLPVVNDECKKNREIALKFAKEQNWIDLTIYEKYVRDKVTDSDLPLTIPNKEFERALINLYERSSLYKGM